ncbi:histidinol-phosphatase [Hirschia litorea]|uniref:Histidinol-phosphatase n=1 Tax=Hirschia litorea TaxID=1199156 RepID=A0ABW2INJ1_9PROT
MSDTTYTPAEIQELTAFAERLADAAGKAILPYFRGEGSLADNKAQTGFDPVTIADKAAERAIREIIDAERPDDAIMGEEYGEKSGTSGWTWYLDPIDGTRAFISGLPVWTTLIGLVRDNKSIVGVIDQSYLKERYVGTPSGSYMIDSEGEKRNLKTRPCKKLTDAILATTDYFIFTHPERGAFEHLRATAKLTRYGLDAYAYARVAAGTMDMVAEAGLQPYDVAALIPVIENAGGVVTDWCGRPATLGGQIVAAANQEILDEALISLRRSARAFDCG